MKTIAEKDDSEQNNHDDALDSEESVENILPDLYPTEVVSISGDEHGYYQLNI